jgi:hypothetical protein
MAFDRAKFKTLVHYVCYSYTDDPSKLGAVKLNKSLWLADFTAYYNSGHAITGARYVKRKHGPVPGAIVPILRELESEGALTVKDTQFHGFPKKEYRALTEPDMSGFEPEELALAEAAIKTVCEENTANSISEKSHDHIWHAANDGEEIPYFTIFSLKGKIDDDERDWARQELEAMAR